MKPTTQDGEDSDWSIEIYEGICLPIKESKLPKQISHSRERLPHPFFRTYITQVVPQVQSSTSPSTEKSMIQRQEDQENTARSTRENHPVHPPEFWDIVAKENKDNRCPEPPPSRAFKLAANPKPKSLKNVASPIGMMKPQKETDLEPERKQACKSGAVSTSTHGSFCHKLSSKTNGSALPVYNYLEYRNPAAAVAYTQCEDEANTLVQSLEGPLGFDLEWRVTWQTGATERRIALVQLCDTRTILLIQISSMKRFPKKVLEVLEAPNVMKTGANISNDGEKLYRDFGIRARGLVELGALATKADGKFSSIYNRQIVSLAKMVSLYLGKTLVKDSMVQYAANDCHCALMVFNAILKVATKEGRNLVALSCSCEVNPCTVKLEKTASNTTASGKSRWSGSSSLGPRSLPDYCIPEPISPQYLRAYKMWHERKAPLDRMCAELKMGGRAEPLKASTVISYVVGALQANALLPFDLQELKELVQMDAPSWQRHRMWMQERERCYATLI
ncbi:hypothetical protein J3A83DRAFT_4400639 [Scleroderma citrinum]